MGLTVRADIALLSGFLKRFIYDGFICQIHEADKTSLQIYDAHLAVPLLPSARFTIEKWLMAAGLATSL